MSCLRLATLTATLALVAGSGCSSARIINASPEGGVIAIPSNTNSWPCNYRDQADKLMAQRCPNGFDIVQEDEVVVGRKTITSAPAVTPAGYSEVATPSAVRTSTHAETEYRITFRSKSAGKAAAPAPSPTSIQASAATPLPPPVSNRPLSSPTMLPDGLPARPIPVTAP